MSTRAELHQRLGAHFAEDDPGREPLDYGDSGREFRFLIESVGVSDLSNRGRLCLLGADRQRFLHGQVTNDIERLRMGQGCFAAFVSAKGRVQMPVNVFHLGEELLLDFEPGSTEVVRQRIESYLIADQVEVADAGGAYGLATLQGPRSGECLEQVLNGASLPQSEREIRLVEGALGPGIYCARHSRLGGLGYDLYIPQDRFEAVFLSLLEKAQMLGGGSCGSRARDRARVCAGIPSLGQDMTDAHLAPETGLELVGISYSKGCYIGQEIIARIRTYGQVNKALRGLVILSKGCPARVGDALSDEGGREVGRVTSVAETPQAGTQVALGYVRKEHFALGTEVVGGGGGSSYRARVAGLPYQHIPV